MMIVTDNFYAKVEKVECYREVAGIQTIHEKIINNGVRLNNLTAETDMVIANKEFMHKRIHKA